MKDRNNPNIRVCGMSVSTIVAGGLIKEDTNLYSLYKECLEIYPTCKNKPFRMLKEGFDVVSKYVPADEWFKNISREKRLLFGLSKVTIKGLKSERIYSFNNRDHALKIMYASCHIPLIGGILPTCINENRYYDGIFTQNYKCLPLFPEERNYEDSVIFITAFNDPSFSKCREGWITPQISFPFLWQFFPPNINILNAMFHLGYFRATQFFENQLLDKYSCYFNKNNDKEYLSKLNNITAFFKCSNINNYSFDNDPFII